MSKNRKTFSLFFFLEFFIKNKFFKEKKSVLKYQLLLRSTHVNVISNILLKTLFMNYKNKKKKKKEMKIVKKKFNLKINFIATAAAAAAVEAVAV